MKLQSAPALLLSLSVAAVSPVSAGLWGQGQDNGNGNALAFEDGVDDLLDQIGDEAYARLTESYSQLADD
eukprot:CAMPEP_0183702864 /NCGR_PEP_ID=MMETSP0737-20130205/827_1 /TAXON_ID=385413 /ORGANISM="Thalassiosira miniscula, Strain CCMP1093" /LENGTH=69 /DNA_ID=CAMNT_0025929543 /DNA_START=129 /DNA_END=335 /DNA_ORIENTATION=-